MSTSELGIKRQDSESKMVEEIETSVSELKELNTTQTDASEEASLDSD